MAKAKQKAKRKGLAALKVETFKVKGVEFRMRLASAGTYWMGSPATERLRDTQELRHQVTFTTPFFVGEVPVTQKLFKAVMGKNPSHFKGDLRPVEQVSWSAALEFCVYLSELARREFRLPTEAEWEYACRAGTKGPFYFGKELNATLANFDGSNPYGTKKKGRSIEGTTPVGSYPANAWGLKDLHGNVWEWCSDWYGSYPRDHVIDPQGPAKGDDRVLRGGSWGCDGVRCRSAARNALTPFFERSTVGFRVVAPA